MLLQIEKHQDFKSKEKQILEENRQLALNIENDPHFIQAESSAIALATLQKQIVSFLNKFNIELISIQTTAEKTENGISPMSINIHVKASHNKLSTLLFKLETGDTAGIVQNIDIQRLTNNKSSVAKSDEILNIHIDYKVYMRVSKNG
jgi:uncharacterized protein YcfL